MSTRATGTPSACSPAATTICRTRAVTEARSTPKRAVTVIVTSAAAGVPVRRPDRRPARCGSCGRAAPPSGPPRAAAPRPRPGGSAGPGRAARPASSTSCGRNSVRTASITRSSTDGGGSSGSAAIRCTTRRRPPASANAAAAVRAGALVLVGRRAGLGAVPDQRRVPAAGQRGDRPVRAGRRSRGVSPPRSHHLRQPHPGAVDPPAHGILARPGDLRRSRRTRGPPARAAPSRPAARRAGPGAPGRARPARRRARRSARGSPGPGRRSSTSLDRDRPAPAQHAEAAVGDDAVHPGGERRVAAEPADPPPRVDQRLLQRVLGLARVAHHPHRDPVERGLVAAGQRLERGGRRPPGRARPASARRARPSSSGEERPGPRVPMGR